MNIGFFSPYLDSYGGGERYMLTLASHWSKTHEVSLFWDDETITRTSEKHFQLDLSRVKVKQNVFGQSLLKKSIVTSQYDLIFILSDGSIPVTFAKHNILHFQVPFTRIVFPLRKRLHYQSIVCNSVFTKDNIDVSVGKDAIVIYPPVDVEKFSPGKKKKQILSVGRFTSHENAKKQNVLIEAFKQGCSKGLLKDYSLILAGSMLEGDCEFTNGLKKDAKGFPIEFAVNCPFTELVRLFNTSTFYWHAAGYGETNPQNMEHFGISTVEAMASGTIPLVYAAGGQKEIIQDGKNGYLWDSIQSLLAKTDEIQKDSKLQKELQRQMMLDTKKFSVSVFTKAFDELLVRICG